MNFEEWLESKGHIDGYRTDYQSAYDGGFDEGVKTQQAKIDILQIKLNGADERAAAVLNHKNKMIDELQREITFQEKAIKNIKLQFENKQIDCDSSDRKIDELQARVDKVLIEMKNQLGDEDYYDMERPDYDAMLYALRNIKDILIK